MSRTLDSSQRFHSLPSTMVLLLFIDSTLFYQRAPLALQNQRFSLSSAPRLPDSGRHPHPTSPTAPACRRRSAAGATAMMHIDPEDRLLPPVSPPRRCERGEGVFLESHQRPPGRAVSWVGRLEPQGTMAASLIEPFGRLRVFLD